jgi:hypothetical protein
MTEGPAHISDAMVRAFTEVGGVHGQFRGMRLSEFAYPDLHSPEAMLFDYRLPFEDCGTFALGNAVQPRRFVVPGMLLAMPDSPASQQLIKALSWLYCAAWLDCAYASFNRCTADRSEASLWTHINELRQLLTRFENAVNLLTQSPLASASVVCLLRGSHILAAATAKAMHEGFDILIRPTLWYEKDGLRAVNIRTEFSPEQWMSRLHLACVAALGQASDFPALPRLQGDAKNGYVLRLQDHETAQANVCAAHQNQPGALRRAC